MSFGLTAAMWLEIGMASANGSADARGVPVLASRIWTERRTNCVNCGAAVDVRLRCSYCLTFRLPDAPGR